MVHRFAQRMYHTSPLPVPYLTHLSTVVFVGVTLCIVVVRRCHGMRQLTSIHLSVPRCVRHKPSPVVAFFLGGRGDSAIWIRQSGDLSTKGSCNCPLCSTHDLVFGAYDAAMYFFCTALCLHRNITLHILDMCYNARNVLPAAKTVDDQHQRPLDVERNPHMNITPRSLQLCTITQWSLGTESSRIGASTDTVFGKPHISIACDPQDQCPDNQQRISACISHWVTLPLCVKSQIQDTDETRTML